MTCPRCRSENTRVLTSSPVPGAWELLKCERCVFTWRSTEPADMTDPDRYPTLFRLSEEDIAAAKDVPVIPQLRTE